MIICFYDLETTGFSKEHNDIIEIAGAIWDSQKDQILDTFTEYIKPVGKIPPIITQLTGISMDKVKDCDNIWNILPQFYEFMMSYKVEKMVGYNNAVFDYPFILAQMNRYKLSEKFNFPQYEQVDVLKIVRGLKKKKLIELSDCKQSTVATHFNIIYDAHDAINDTLALVRIYKEIRKIDPTLI